MNNFFKVFFLSIKLIVKDPINLTLAIIPTLIALGIYGLGMATIVFHLDKLTLFFKSYIYTSDYATILAKLLAIVLIVFLFFIMSWSFVLVVGIVSSPFNSLLSSRIEQTLVGRKVSENVGILKSLRKTFAVDLINEFKKLSFIILLAMLALLLNLIPLFYPVAIFIFCLSLSIQFVDYSWSRHGVPFSECFNEVMRNLISYFISGFVFLILVAIPFLNALIPAIATSYFTVLWLHQKKMIELSS